jgi:hypothetical protein
MNTENLQKERQRLQAVIYDDENREGQQRALFCPMKVSFVEFSGRGAGHGE